MPSTSIYTLSLHDALPICVFQHHGLGQQILEAHPLFGEHGDAALLLVGISEDADVNDRRSEIARAINIVDGDQSRVRDIELPADRKSTRLNSSHSQISYAVHLDLHSFPTRRSSDLCISTPRTWPANPGGAPVVR